MPLQRKLTLSHLSVVVVSAMIIATLTLLGYWIYTLTDRSASWVADLVLAESEDIWYALDDSEVVLDTTFAQTYVDEWYGYFMYSEAGLLNVEPSNDEMQFEDWALIIDVDGTILGSNYQRLFPVGRSIFEVDAPGLERVWPFAPPDYSTAFADVGYGAFYAKVAEHHVSLAPIVSDDEQLLGYFYLRADASQAVQIIGQTAEILGWGLLGAALVAIILSGIMGSRLARSLAQRIAQLSAASDAFAAGDFSQRVAVEGKDEIARLSAEFNKMATQIETQIDTMRDLTRLDERNRLARELHDAIKQQLFGLNLTVGSASSIIESKPNVARQRLEQASTMTQNILEEMDAIIQQLRPASLEDRGLATALTDLVKQWETQTSIPVALTVVSERELPLQVEQAVYRIAQEALNNIARHANAQHVILSLEYDLHELRLMIVDDGRGFDMVRAPSTTSHGLRNMQERAVELGGTLKLNSQPGKGAALHLRVPIADGFQ